MANYWSHLLLSENSHDGLIPLGCHWWCALPLSLSVCVPQLTLKPEFFSVQAHRCNLSQSVGLSNIAQYSLHLFGNWKTRWSHFTSQFYNCLIFLKLRTHLTGFNLRGTETLFVCDFSFVSCELADEQNGSQIERSFYRLHQAQWCLSFIPHLTPKAQWRIACLSVCLSVLNFSVYYIHNIEKLNTYCNFYGDYTVTCTVFCGVTSWLFTGTAAVNSYIMKAWFTRITMANVTVSHVMKKTLCDVTNCHCARRRFLVEDLIASTFRFFLEVLIGQENPSKRTNKAKCAGFNRCVFLSFLFRKLG